MARASRARVDAQQIACRRRWPVIVSSMRTLVARYNEGAATEAVVLVEHRTAEDDALSLEVASGGHHVLTMTLDGTELWVREAHGAGLAGEQRWIDFGRPDEAIAAYVLQNWMTQL